jgi:FkbM family methyltransferase
MEFTESLFQRRLSQILAATADWKAGPADPRGGRRPVAFRFSRKRQRRVEATSPPSLSSRIASLTRSVDELVLDYGRSRREAAQAGIPLPRIAFAEVDGHVLWAPASDWKLVCHYLMSGGLDPGLAHFFRRNIHPADGFVDIGASLGAYTILAASLTGDDGVVHSFEADPDAYRWLIRNLDETGFGGGGRVRPKQVWIGAVLPEMPSTADDRADFPVPTAAVDDLVGFGERVDFVRIGGCYAISHVLRSMSRVCRENPQCRIVVDYCATLQPRGTNLLSIIDDIESMDFPIQQIDSRTGEIVPLRRGDAAGAFSVHLLLEPRRGIRWSR